MRIIAHRSGPTKYPEQTIASAQLALEQGADMVEVDVRFTADGKIAICHDENTERVFGVNKKVREMTENEFLSLRHVKEPNFCAHSFEDYLLCGVAPILLHIKEAEVIDELLQVIDQYEYADKVVMGVQSAESAVQIKSYNPNIKVLAFMPKADKILEFAQAGVDYIRLWEDWLTPENINAVRAQGTEMWVMIRGKGLSVGETTPAELEKVLNLQPDGVLINDVTVLK